MVGVMQGMRPIFVLWVGGKNVKMAGMNATEAVNAFMNLKNEFIIAVIKSKMAVMNSKMAIIETIIAIMKTIIAVMNSLFQILNS